MHPLIFFFSLSTHLSDRFRQKWELFLNVFLFIHYITQVFEFEYLCNIGDFEIAQLVCLQNKFC